MEKFLQHFRTSSQSRKSLRFHMMSLHSSKDKIHIRKNSVIICLHTNSPEKNQNYLFYFHTKQNKQKNPKDGFSSTTLETEQSTRVFFFLFFFCYRNYPSKSTTTTLIQHISITPKVFSCPLKSIPSSVQVQELLICHHSFENFI